MYYDKIKIFITNNSNLQFGKDQRDLLPMNELINESNESDSEHVEYLDVYDAMMKDQGKKFTFIIIEI